MELTKYVKPYRVTCDKFQFDDVDPGDTLDLDIGKAEAKELLSKSVEMLSVLHEKLYAQDQWGVLVIFQGMDAAGKDSAIKHVMSGVNPQGCSVHCFKAPTVDELAHDFMWRAAIRAPARGEIGIFDRSYYEEVLVARVHPEILQSQKLPRALITKKIWDERLQDIRAYEHYLTRNGIVLLKFFLHVSKEEQKKRFLSRLNKQDKHWKFAMLDIKERRYWDDYMYVYQEAIRATSTEEAPWHVVPADNKWFTRLVVAATIIDRLQKLEVELPKTGEATEEEMAVARAALLHDE
jgi:PPK2 family polyphosphate:nucleotide phosphotransferase